MPQSYVRAFADWPFVLCGPMLRRVTSTSVSVFVALKQEAQVELVIYANASATPQQVGTASAPTLALGANLHVAVVELQPAQRLQPDTPYTYDLRFTTLDAASSAPPPDLEHCGLLAGAKGLGYAHGVLPGFALPPSDRTRLRIVHGSCRKPHGGGGDMLAVVDAMIDGARMSTRWPDATLRPHQLLLTGDQIYADDVAPALALAVNEAARMLYEPQDGSAPAEPERIRNRAGSLLAANRREVAPGSMREYFLRQEAALSGDLLTGHLMYAHEFYAMYLMAWSDALWPRSDADPERIEFPPSQERSWCARRSEKDAQRALVSLFGATLPRVRRVLANVPTLTIFDDHEITDDWYLNAAWRKKAWQTASARQIVRNGLVAYAVFQDWGNQPADYVPGTAGGDMLTAIAMQGSAAPPLHSDPQALDAVLDLEYPAPAVPAPRRKRWNYAVRWPGHDVVVLDTRTWRQSTSLEPESAPALIGADELVRQLAPLADAGDRITLVLSGAPIVGLIGIESGQAALTAATGAAAQDNEGWASNRIGFDAVLAKLAERDVVVVLSGDVHYAFTNTTDYLNRRVAPARRARIVQLCCSSLKNQTAGTLASPLAQGAAAVLEGIAGPVAPLHAAMQAALAAVGAPPSAEIAARLEALALRLAVIESLDEPPLFVRDVVHNGAPFNDFFRLLDEHAADARYRVRFLSDARAPDARDAWLPGYPDAGDDPTVLAPTALATSSIVGAANVGGITFSPGADGTPRLQHTLYFAVYPVAPSSALIAGGFPPRDALTTTVHEVELRAPRAGEI